MAWQYTPHTPALTLATIVGLIVTAIAWRKRADPAARWATYVNCSIAAWAALHLVTVTNTIFEVKLYAFALALGNICFLAVLVLGYVIHYTGREEQLTHRRLAALLALPLSLIVLLATDGTRELVLADPRVDSSGSVDRLRYTWGPLWFAYASACYVIDAVSLGLLAQKFTRSRNVYRKITLVVFLAVLIPVVGTLLSLFGHSPFPHFVLLPHLVLFTSALVVLTMTSITVVRMIPLERLLAPFRSRFGNLVPLARDVVLEEVDNGIVILNTDGRIVDINTTGKRMIGADRPIGKHFVDATRTSFIVDPDIDFSSSADSPTDLAGTRSEIRIAPTDSEEYCYDVRISAIGTAADPAGVVILLHDITDQKHREETLRDRERELERQKSNLQSQTRQLEHQNERLDEFASIVSHDLRNPLNVAGGYLELIDDAAGTDEGVDPEHVAEVRRAHERMETIIEDALTLARNGRAITETEAVSVRDVATDAWSTVDTGDASLEFELDRDRGGGRPAGDERRTAELVVEADRTRLLTAFENLFRNAVEHAATSRSEPDERAVTVTVGRLGNGNGFYVADDGPGIPADRREKVLEQGYTTTSEGTGLGLSIVQNVVNAHGWNLSIAESERGGARFEIAAVPPIRSGSSGTVTRIEK